MLCSARPRLCFINCAATSLASINTFTAGNNAPRGQDGRTPKTKKEVDMKKICITFCVLLILITAAVCARTLGASDAGDNTRYLRIHVRANSDSAHDQQVKYAVKDDVVAYITPYVAQCGDKQTAMEKISALTDDIEDVCERSLAALGESYGARAEVRREHFPTRVYDGLTLEEGDYDALIVELGEGDGDNWWCVIYPPLCFTSAPCGVEYRSLILEIIDKFFNGAD